MKSAEKKETKKNKVCNAMCYLVESVDLCAVTIVGIHKIMLYVCGVIYKTSVKLLNEKKNDDYRVLVIEKKKANRYR